MFESLATKYLEAASSKLSLRYVFIFFIGLILSFQLNESRPGGIIDSFLATKFLALLSEQYWARQNPTFAHALFAAAFVFSGVFVERSGVNILFFLMDRVNSYKKRIRAIYNGADLKLPPKAERQSEISIIETALAPVVRRINFFVSIAQFCGAFGAFLIIAPAHSCFDISIGALLLLVAFLSTVRSVQIFISDYFPLASFRNLMQGRQSVDSVDLVG